MTYKVGGVEITIQPTSGRWIPREALGYDGNGQPIYPPTREFQIDWGLIDMDTFYQLQNFYDSVAVTGSVIVDLPQYGTTPYAFSSYTGCVISEPQVSRYFSQNVINARMIVSRIRT